MERIDPQTISNAILTAPGWARLGITMSEGEVGLKAAQEMAENIIRALVRQAEEDCDQLALPL